MYRFFLLVVAVLPGSVLADEPPAPGEDLFPLAIGNTWTYRVLTPLPQEDRFVVRVVRKEMVGEQTCFLLEAVLKDKVVATEHLAFTREGLTRFRADKEDIIPPVTVLQLPVARARDWKAKYQLGERTSSVTFKRDTSPSRIVDMPSGRIQAVKIDAEITSETGNLTRSSIWYATGTGMVRQTISGGKGPPFTVLELEKFEKGE